MLFELPPISNNDLARLKKLRKDFEETTSKDNKKAIKRQIMALELKIYRNK